MLYFFRRHENFSRLTAIGGTDNMHDFHCVDHAGGTRKADTKTALQHGYGGLSRFQDHHNRLFHQFVFKEIAAVGLFFLLSRRDGFVILRLALRLNIFDDFVDFVVRYESALNAHRL